jgi:hypothetical protein
VTDCHERFPVHQRSQRQQVPWFRDKCDYDPYFANGACQSWHAYQYEHFGKIYHPLSSFDRK